MKRPILTPLALALTGFSLSGGIQADTFKECYNGVCATLETPTCVAEGEPFNVAVEGELSGASGFAITAYQVLRDANWRYNANHQVVVDEAEVIDAKGFLFSGTFNNSYPQTGGEGSRYTFVFGSRNFGHGFYDVAVEAELGGGGATTSVPLDIKPGACPNPVNAHQKGVLPVAILGSDALDVRNIDPATVRLAGVPALRYAFEDVGAPIPGQTSSYECAISGGDGTEDMSLKFKSEEIVAALEAELGRPLFDGEVIPLQLTASLKEATSACAGGLFGVDNITVLSRGQGKNR